ncbi:MAG: hypothetical protein RL490_2702 [Pseudomonadota bacterium]
MCNIPARRYADGAWGNRVARTEPAWRQWWQRRLATGKFAFALPGIIVTLLVLALHVADVPALHQLGNLLFDEYNRQLPRPFEDAAVRIVDIDDTTIAREGQWPWPRTDVARLTQALTEAGAAAIAFDIVFSESDRTSPARIAAVLARNPLARGSYPDVARLADHDRIFADALAAAPSIPGFFLTREPNRLDPPDKSGVAIAGSDPGDALPGFSGTIPPLPELAAAAPGSGFVSIVGDNDGIIRRAPLLARIHGRIVPSLSLEALRVAQGAGAIIVKSTDASGELGGGEIGVSRIKVGAFEVPTTSAGELWMHYTAPRPDRIVPAWKILEGRLSPAEMRRLFEGHIIFIGTGASGLRDLVATPIRDRELGVVVHAQAVEQMILGTVIGRPDWAPGVERLALLLFGIGLSLLLPRLGAARGALLAAVALAAAVTGSWYLFSRAQLLVDPTVPALGVVLAYSAVTLLTFYREEKARSYIHRAFDRYLSPELVDRIARDPGQLELGGEERDMTVMFCDVRSFSALSEKLKPNEIIGFLIEFLTPMTDLLLTRKATIDKYIGDAILAFWNAPLDDAEHPENAARGALDMVARLRLLNDPANRAADSLWPGEVKIGIGLNCGPCCVGNMGSSQRLSYSLIGDTVNLASRIEGLTKYYGVTIAIGSSMAERLPGFALIELDQVRVVGRATPERLYALLGDEGLSDDAAFQALAVAQDRLLAAYRHQDWDGADAALAAWPGATFGLGKLGALYAERIAAFRSRPPGPGWDGVFQAVEK